MLEKITASLKKVYEILKNAGYECFVVGGSVRDYLTHQNVISDFDLATDAYPEKVIQLFHRVIPTGIKHGTVTVLIGKERFEITTYRLDGKYSDGRRPDQINFAPGIIEDLKRRDFTMNSIAYDLGTDTFLDPNHGMTDIKNKLIRAIGDPISRFQEDGLRPLRAIRFVSQLGFRIEKSTLEAIQECKEMPSKVSHERITAEFFKMAQGQDAVRALMILEKTGLLGELLPSIRSSNHFSSFGEWIKYYKRAAQNIKKICIENLTGRLTFLFCLAWGFGSTTLSFYDASTIKEKRIQDFKSVAKQYRFSTKMISIISHLLQFVPFPMHIISTTDYEVRLFLKALQKEYISQIIVIWQALAADQSELDKIVALECRFKQILSIPKTALILKELNITGDELIENLGLKPGKQVGIILEGLLDQTLRDPSKNDKETLLILARDL